MSFPIIVTSNPAGTFICILLFEFPSEKTELTSLSESRNVTPPMKKFVLPTICIDEVKFCKEGKFFFLKYNDSGYSHIMAKHGFDELLYNIQKQGYDIINSDGSLYDIKQGA